MEHLPKVIAEIQTDEEPEFDNEDNGPGDVSEENFLDHESFREQDTESEEDGDSGNKDANNSEWFSSKDGVQCRETQFSQNIRNNCHNIVSRLPGTKGPAKNVTNPVRSWELFINDNMKQLIVEGTNIFVEKCSPNISRESDARKRTL
ncbi:hypothetical protein AVEN_26563-1 [Araneus ventricosus]|uniref:PiggyBac transposable element-derived protein domain-containing protein n=1 Tax=Araneus ventricosus TaxID=182803 RepID=A0A4Y2FRQ6_ARAVE|nr:hypothetical protein AVEN_26563-1 [Araneus ventricosus]